MQTLLIVLVLGCSSSLLGCNSIQQDEPIVDDSDGSAGCESSTSLELQQDPNQPSQDPSLIPKPLFYSDVLAVFSRSEYKCATCHGDQYTQPDAIVQKWARVYGALESGFMPRGAKHVTPEDLTLLRNWQQAGFPKTQEDTLPQATPASVSTCTN